jgi:hypothetical protein
MAPFALSYVLGTITCTRDLPPLDGAHAGRTIKTGRMGIFHEASFLRFTPYRHFTILKLYTLFFQYITAHRH